MTPELKNLIKADNESNDKLLIVVAGTIYILTLLTIAII